MAQKSVTHALAAAQRATATNARQRMKMRAFENALIRKAAVSVTACGYGVMKRHSVSDEIQGFPWKLGIWVGSTLVEALAASQVVTNFAAGLSDATMAVYLKDAVQNKTLIAGEGGELA
jgi:hypothetical protein